MSEIIYLTDDTLKHSIGSNKMENLLVIDVREPEEYAREHIRGSRNIPLSKLESSDLSNEKSRPVLFHCKLGSRTRMANDILAASGFETIYCLDGGIEQWKRCGLPIEKNASAPIEIMRQVQIVVGSMVLLGVLLGYFLGPGWLFLSGFAGCGLVFAGLSGSCAMARLLGCAPWNRRSCSKN